MMSLYTSNQFNCWFLNCMTNFLTQCTGIHLQVLHLLRLYLGEYVRGLSVEALKISVWKGQDHSVYTLVSCLEVFDYYKNMFVYSLYIENEFKFFLTFSAHYQAILLDQIVCYTIICNATLVEAAQVNLNSITVCCIRHSCGP